jgi:hypothetical protein
VSSRMKSTHKFTNFQLPEKKRLPASSKFQKLAGMLLNLEAEALQNGHNLVKEGNQAR